MSFRAIHGTVADPGGPGGPGPPAPVKTSKKKDGHHTAPQVSRVIASPPLTNFWIHYCGVSGKISQELSETAWVPDFPTKMHLFPTKHGRHFGNTS